VFNLAHHVSLPHRGWASRPCSPGGMRSAHLPKVAIPARRISAARAVLPCGADAARTGDETRLHTRSSELERVLLPGWGTEPHEVPGLQFARLFQVCTPNADEGTPPVSRTRERRSCSSIHTLSGDLKRAIWRTSQQPARRTAAPATPSHRGQRRHLPLVAAAGRGMPGRVGRRRGTGERFCPSVQSTNKAHHLYVPLHPSMRDMLQDPSAGVRRAEVLRTGAVRAVALLLPSHFAPLLLQRTGRARERTRGLQVATEERAVSWSRGCASASCLNVA